jgi:hypothetical protein
MFGHEHGLLVGNIIDAEKNNSNIGRQTVMMTGLTSR